MSLSLNDLKKKKKAAASNPVSSQVAPKTKVLRPWESFDNSSGEQTRTLRAKEAVHKALVQSQAAEVDNDTVILTPSPLPTSILRTAPLPRKFVSTAPSGPTGPLPGLFKLFAYFLWM